MVIDSVTSLQSMYNIENILSVGLWKYLYNHQLDNKAYFGDIAVKKHLSEFYPQDGGESQLVLKLRHCHPRGSGSKHFLMPVWLATTGPIAMSLATLRGFRRNWSRISALTGKWRAEQSGATTTDASSGQLQSTRTRRRRRWAVDVRVIELSTHCARRRLTDASLLLLRLLLLLLRGYCPPPRQRPQRIAAVDYIIIWKPLFHHNEYSR